MPARSMVLLSVAATLLLSCGIGSDGSAELSADHAVLCRELGGGVVHIRYETDEGPVVRNQHGVDHERAQMAEGVSEEAARVLEVRGWDEEALDELSRPQELSPDVAALLDEMPSCLDELREQG